MYVSCVRSMYSLQKRRIYHTYFLQKRHTYNMYFLQKETHIYIYVRLLCKKYVFITKETYIFLTKRDAYIGIYVLYKKDVHITKIPASCFCKEYIRLFCNEYILLCVLFATEKCVLTTY